MGWTSLFQAQLAGSGSNDWLVDDVFVPEEHGFSLFDEPRVGGALFAYPWLIVANAPGVSLGIARASIDALCALDPEASRIDPETQAQLVPFCEVAEKLGAFASQLVERRLSQVRIIYAGHLA